MENTMVEYIVGHVAHDGYLYSLFESVDLSEAEEYAARISAAPGRRIEIRRVTTTKKIEEIFANKG